MKIKVKPSKPDDSNGAVRVFSKPIVGSTIIADPIDKILKKEKSFIDRILDLIRVH
jgi:hypothetical protein|nr:MAG TPA: hypothetical protein [Caudoviricetes sp.]